MPWSGVCVAFFFFDLLFLVCPLFVFSAAFGVGDGAGCMGAAGAVIGADCAGVDADDVVKADADSDVDCGFEADVDPGVVVGNDGVAVGNDCFVALFDDLPFFFLCGAGAAEGAGAGCVLAADVDSGVAVGNCFAVFFDDLPFFCLCEAPCLCEFL